MRSTKEYLRWINMSLDQVRPLNESSRGFFFQYQNIVKNGSQKKVLQERSQRNVTRQAQGSFSAFFLIKKCLHCKQCKNKLKKTIYKLFNELHYVVVWIYLCFAIMLNTYKQRKMQCVSKIFWVVGSCVNVYFQNFKWFLLKRFNRIMYLICSGKQIFNSTFRIVLLPVCNRTWLHARISNLHFRHLSPRLIHSCSEQLLPLTLKTQNSKFNKLTFKIR